MNKKLFCLFCALIVLFVTAAASAETVKSDELKLYNQNTRYVEKSFGNAVEGSFFSTLPTFKAGPLYSSLPTYRKESTNDITYVNIEDFVRTACADLQLSVEKAGPGSLNILNSDHLCIMNIDAEKNIVTYYRQDMISPQLYGSNNGVYGDSISLGEVVQESDKTHYIGALKSEVIDLNDYHLGFELNENGCYAPIQLLSAIFYKGIKGGAVYNGVDIYPASVIEPTGNGNSVSYYANTDRFLADGSHEAVMSAPASDEAYRFTYSDTEGDTAAYYTISLRSDGSGGLYVSDDENSLGELKTENKFYFDLDTGEVKFADMNCLYQWYETEEGIFVDPYFDSGDEKTNTSVNDEFDLFKIPKARSYYGTGIRSKETAELNYNLLAFLFEKCYGLTEAAFPNGFYRAMEDQHLKERLLDTDSKVYDDALLDLTMGVVDDIHTTYLNRSIYSGYAQEDMTELRKAHSGERRLGLFDFEEKYKNLRTQIMSAEDPKYADSALQQGLFMEGSTAVIRFDSFVVEAFDIGDQPAQDADISERIAVDTPDGIELAFREISKNQNIQNVVFDLTCNTGGVMNIAPYLIAYMTDDPELTYYSSIRDIGLDNHYSVDINRDGTIDENDTYMGHYNFYMLTSETSFSCGNTVPVMAKLKGIPILGHRSGGGACEAFKYMDACGSQFYSSAEMVVGIFNDEGAFTSADGGVELDYELEPEAWYDLNALNRFLESLSK